MKIGFIGLGRMGQGMALNILKSGADLVVYDANPDAVKVLTDAGSKAAKSVSEIASQVDVLFTSLPGPVQVEEVVFGPLGVIANMTPNLTLIELSTSSLTLGRRIYGAMKEKGGGMLDAPVSGGPAGAASGNLAFWVGGERDVYERHLALLKTFGNAPRYIGKIGAGTVAKLANNMAGYMIMHAMAEVFSMAVKAEVDPMELWFAMRAGMVGKQSPLFMLTSQFLPGQFENPAFALKLAHKDVTLGTALARELGVPMRMANMTLEEMTEALAKGYGEQDSRAYLKVQLERAGVTIAVDPERLKEAINS